MAESPHRVQVAAPLTGTAGTLVQQVRVQFDPTAAAAIGPHITALYESDLAGRSMESVLAHLSRCAAATIELGPVNPWADSPSAGLYLPVLDPHGTIGTWRQGAAERSPAYRPHVTLLHHRTLDPATADLAWQQLNDTRIVEGPVRLDRLQVVEMRDGQWTPTAELVLGSD